MTRTPVRSKQLPKCPRCRTQIMCSGLPCAVLCVGCGGEVTVHADHRVTFLPPIRCVRCTLRLPSVNPLLTPTVRCPDCGTEQSVDT